MSQSQQVAQRLPENLEKTWHARTAGNLKAVAIRQRKNLEDVNLVPEDIYLPPMKPELPDGVTRADGDLWYDV